MHSVQPTGRPSFVVGSRVAAGSHIRTGHDLLRGGRLIAGKSAAAQEVVVQEGEAVGRIHVVHTAAELESDVVDVRSSAKIASELAEGRQVAIGRALDTCQDCNLPVAVR